MKLDNKGFAISSILYLILVMAIILIALILAVLSGRKMILDKTKQEVLDNIYIDTDIDVRLPSIYQEVEYIQSTGTQYIDTKIPVISGTKMSADIIYSSAETNNYTGAHIDSDRIFFGSWNQGIYQFGVGSVNLSTNINYGGRHILEVYWLSGNSYIKVDTSIPNTVSNTFSDHSNYNFYMFALNRNGTASLFSKIRTYNWKWWQNGELIRNFIPCYRKSDNEIGMYDLVENKFYTNVGSGEFLKGNNI